MTGMVALGIDKTSGLNVQLAPRVGAAVPAGRRTVINASWGRAFEVPSLYALGNPNVGNPNLRTEELTGMDIGARHQFGQRVSVAGTYYYNLFSDLIDFSAVDFSPGESPSGANPRCRNSFVDHGSRNIGKYLGTLLNWEVKSSSEPLRNQPRWNSGFTIETRFPKAIRAFSTRTWVDRA